MAYLHNLKVNKISFVDSPANQRSFLLLKSATVVDDNNKNVNKQEEHSVRPEVRTKLTEIRKSTSDPAAIINLLKGDAGLKVTDSEIAEITTALELLKSLEAPPTPAPNPTPTPTPTPTPAPTISVDAFESLRKQNETQAKQIEDLLKANEKSEVTKWVSENCPYYPGSASELVDDIISLRKIDAKAAERLQKSAQSASDHIKNSSMFNENGANTSIDTETVGGDFLKKISAQITTLRKSANNKALSVDEIRDIVKSQGDVAYRQYRREHILRAKQQVSD